MTIISIIRLWRVAIFECNNLSFFSLSLELLVAVRLMIVAIWFIALFTTKRSPIMHCYAPAKLRVAVYTFFLFRDSLYALRLHSEAKANSGNNSVVEMSHFISTKILCSCCCGGKANEQRTATIDGFIISPQSDIFFRSALLYFHFNILLSSLLSSLPRIFN